MDVLHELWESGETLHQILTKTHGVRGGESYPIKAFHAVQGFQKLHKRTFVPDFRKFMPSVEVHDLAE